MIRLKEGVLFGIAIASFTQAARAASYTAGSCSASDVQAAIDKATDGDTVLLPVDCASLGAAATWNAPVDVTSGITLDGGGAYVKFGANGGLAVTADSVTNAFVTGFHFNNGFTGGGCPVSFKTSNAAAPPSQAFRFHDNTFSDDGNQGGQVTTVCVSGFGPGLIDHNTFTTAHGADEVIHILGAVSDTDESGWTNDVTPGGPNMLFIENNTFTNTNTGVTTSAEEAYYGARFVFRYNALNFEQTDVHGGGISTRWSEIYHNTYNITGTTTNLPNYTQTRGGSGVYFGNTSSGTPCCQDPYPSTEFGPLANSSDTDSGPWPLDYQVGRGINETYSPLYVWGDGSPIDTNVSSANPTYVQIGGAATDATHCSEHAGNVCDVVVSSSQPATLQRCESAADVAAGCPVSYKYAPYVYPHPLDTEGQGGASGAGGNASGGTSGRGAGGTASGGVSGGAAGGAAPGTGGASGSAGSAGSAANAAHPSQDSGCGCRVPGRAPTVPSRWWIAALFGALLLERRWRAG
jgi:hypothetical protein